MSHYHHQQPVTHVAGRKPEAIRCPDILGLTAFHHESLELSIFRSAFAAELAQAVVKLPGSIGGNGTNITAGLRGSLDLMAKVPAGLRRRVVLLTDGADNHEIQGLPDQVSRAVALHVRIDTIGFGDPTNFNAERLAWIATASPRGQFVPVETARRLGQVITSARQGPKGHVRGEATIFCIDVSPSMNDPMGASTKIGVVTETLSALIRYKQVMWS